MYPFYTISTIPIDHMDIFYPSLSRSWLGGRAVIQREAMGRIFFLVAFFGTLAVAFAGSPERRIVIDPVGRRMEVPAHPQRVVALAPSVTEIIYALGQERRLVGVTRFSDYPQVAEKLPKVGSYIYLDVERIAALRPDVCIGIKDGNPISAVERLEGFGIPVFAVHPVDLDSVMESVSAMGDLLNAGEKARAIVDDMRRRIDRVVRQTARVHHKPKVFVQIGISPIVSVGNNTFIDKLIHLAGGINAAAGDTPYPRFSVEQVLALAPEVIIITSMDRTALFEQVRDGWRQWPAIPAVRDNAVYIAPTNIFDRPTPRLVDGLETMARFIHPALFESEP
jgi:iron complex transport system substrate-binding protein